MTSAGVLAPLSAPFDLVRMQYASAVSAGMLRRSLLTSGRLERALDGMERLLLGPFARRR